MTRRRATKRREVEALPTPPAPLAVERVCEAGPEGGHVTHYRTVDTIGLMARNGTITPQMEAAAREFERAFALAGLETLRAQDLERVSGSGRPQDLTDGQLAARRKVFQALEAVGGMAGPTGSVIWHVIGRGESVREWRQRWSWTGRRISQDEARGVLLAALEMLAKHLKVVGVPAPRIFGLDPQQIQG